MEQAVIFVFGAVSYSAVEILWRGYTHWTMAIAGGICAFLIYIYSGKSDRGIMFRSLFGAFVITAVEFSFGIVINVVLKWDVWDYSRMPFNILGQICPYYFVLWFLLCIPVIKLFDYFHIKASL